MLDEVYLIYLKYAMCLAMCSASMPSVPPWEWLSSGVMVMLTAALPPFGSEADFVGPASTSRQAETHSFLHTSNVQQQPTAAAIHSQASALQENNSVSRRPCNQEISQGMQAMASTRSRRLQAESHAAQLQAAMGPATHAAHGGKSKEARCHSRRLKGKTEHRCRTERVCACMHSLLRAPSLHSRSSLCATSQTASSSAAMASSVPASHAGLPIICAAHLPANPHADGEHGLLAAADALLAT